MSALRGGGPLLAVRELVAAAISATGVSLREPSRESTSNVSSVNAQAFAQALSGAAGGKSSTLVAPVRTRLDSGQASDALRSAWQAVTGKPPSESTVRILTAQWAHETGRGASMFNYNFGGIKGAGPSGLSVAQRTHEGFGENERAIVDRFRAYTTAEEGATDYVRLLHARFPEACQAAQGGDAVGFVHALKSRGYFTGDEAAYTRSVVALSGMEMPALGASPTPPALAPDFSVEGRLALAMADGRMAGSDATPALIDSLSLADEISRAALRIASATSKDQEGG